MRKAAAFIPALSLILSVIILFFPASLSAGKNAEPDTVHLYPEWIKPRILVWVWPAGLYGYKELVPLYKNLLSYVPAGQELAITVKQAGSAEILQAHIEKECPSIKVKILTVPEVNDIWIRDFGFLSGRNEEGHPLAARFIYRPAYYPEDEMQYAEEDYSASAEIARLLGYRLLDIPLIADGGNFTYNGAGTAIVSNRVIADNENLSLEEIRGIFRKMLGIDKLIFVPVEPGDATGHIDGMVRFAGKNTLVMSEYPADCKEAAEFSKKLKALLIKELGKDINIIRVPCYMDPDDTSDIPGAEGNYINYLMLGNTLLLPQYGTAGDAIALAALKEGLPSFDIIPLELKDFNLLAKKGGVLNCISTVLH